ncbi:hypothetical protein QTP88_010928 [Uroleucon formosanum]
MEPDVADAVLSVCGLIVTEFKNQIVLSKEKKKKRKYWVRNWVARRNTLGASNVLIQELKNEDLMSFKNYLRMDEGHFSYLLSKVEKNIQKQNTFLREALSAKIKLEITLRFLATGELQYFFRVPKCSISKFVPTVCEEIYRALEEYITFPVDSEELSIIGNGFIYRWDFPGCYGALDGKHVVMKAPPNSGSDFFNYKGTFSIVLLAVVDHNYYFRFIDVGASGRSSDGGIFRNSSLKIALENRLLNILKDGFFVTDDVFPLTLQLMKPYSRRQLTKEQRIFNYRLSRARRIVENAFGIMASRFQIYMKPISLAPEKVEIIVKSTCVLHNWLQTTFSSYIMPGSIDEENVKNFNFKNSAWRNEIQPMGLDVPPLRIGQHPPRNANEKREMLCQYVNGEGAVSWQDNIFNI